MGLYQSELSKQMFLRNKQKREWDAIRKKTEVQNTKRLLSEETETQLDNERRDDDAIELQETDLSKKLSQSMLRSARCKDEETMQKMVDLLHNQNGNLCNVFLIYFFQSTNLLQIH